MDIEIQDAIAAEGAAALRAYRPDLKGENWRINPYGIGTTEHDLWLAGYEAEAERIGTEGQDI